MTQHPWILCLCLYFLEENVFCRHWVEIFKRTWTQIMSSPHVIDQVSIVGPITVDTTLLETRHYLRRARMLVFRNKEEEKKREIEEQKKQTRKEIIDIPPYFWCKIFSYLYQFLFWIKINLRTINNKWSFVKFFDCSGFLSIWSTTKAEQYLCLAVYGLHQLSIDIIFDKLTSCIRIYREIGQLSQNPSYSLYLYYNVV